MASARTLGLTRRIPLHCFNPLYHARYLVYGVIRDFSQFLKKLTILFQVKIGQVVEKL